MSRSEIAKVSNARRALIAALFVLGCAGVLYTMRTEHPSAALSPQTPRADVRSGFISRIREVGPRAAYAEFTAAYGREGFDLQHNAAHIFGESLYTVKGINGITACDAQFNFGCYHGFMARAIAAEGLSTVTKLDAICLQGAGAGNVCQHGIGHGILEFLGHQKLVEALTACGRTTQPNPIAGCTSGVFMEYNVPLVTNGNGGFTVEPRKMENAEQPYDVCPGLPVRYRESCYHELPQWWHQVLTPDLEKLGSLCAHVGEVRERNACFDGIAHIVPSSAGYDVPAIIRLCNVMPDSSTQETCRIVAAWSLVDNVGQTEAAQKLCRTVSESARSRCPHP